jgi:glutathione S-transferase
MSDSLPTLWQIDVSHYSEKARWALAWKEVEHRRRSPVPGAHMAIALWLTRGAHYTFPVLSLEGRRIGDSTAIVAALEERYPAAPLYPADVAQRLRALELEEFFDEELGPFVFRAGGLAEAERARVKILAGLDRLEAELGDGEYLVGEQFSVADLTAASLFYPLALPEEGPLKPGSPSARGFETFREPLLERRGIVWVKEMFRRHRKPAKAPATVAMSS